MDQDRVTTQQWTSMVTAEGMRSGASIQVVLCGACSIVDDNGCLQRNTGRDGLASWLNANNITFFEVQVHMSTHGRGYEFALDAPAEQQARADAHLRIYEVRNDTQAIITLSEIIQDAHAGTLSIIWIRNGANVFQPHGLGSPAEILQNDELKKKVGPCVHQHLVQYAKAATLYREYFWNMFPNTSNVMVVEGELNELVITLSSMFSL